MARSPVFRTSVTSTPPPDITPDGYPWGAVIASQGIPMTAEIFVENNDIRFNFMAPGLSERITYMARTFDPAGLHVKDFVTGLSATDPSDLDPSAARINNVAGQCSACDYQPGRWRTFVLAARNSVNVIQTDGGKPLKYGPYTALTGSLQVQLVDELSVSV